MIWLFHFLQEFKVTYIIYGIKFYHKSHIEQPFLLSDMRTMQYFAKSSKTGQQIFLSGMKEDNGIALSPLTSSLLGSRTGFSCLKDAMQNKISWGAQGGLGRSAVLQGANNASGI